MAIGDLSTSSTRPFASRFDVEATSSGRIFGQLG